MFNSPIAISLSPNTQLNDIWQAVKILFQPWSWKEGRAVEKVEQWFKDYFAAADTISFNSGRSALYGILKSFDIGRGDEVLLQAFTCVAVPDPIIWIGGRPIYVDIDETLNIDSRALEKYINKKTKAIIVQHTFGVPAKIEMIKKIAQKHNLILIEDCAHAFGGSLNGQKLGTFGDAAFFSFGRDKIISSVFGGMAMINRKLKIENRKLKEYQQELSFPNFFWIFQQLLHPLAFSLILPLYNFFAVGKMILRFLQKLNLLSFPVSPEEKAGGRPKGFPARLPNALAVLALNQLKNLDKFNQKRGEFGKFYSKNLKNLPIKLPENLKLPFLRYPILTERAEELRRFARKRGVILGDWYSCLVDPKGVDLEKVGYQLGGCPKAERIARQIVNLPTYPRMTSKDVKRVIEVIYEFFGRKYNASNSIKLLSEGENENY